MDRRKFIQQNSVLALTLLATKANANFFKTHKDLGIQLYTVRDEIKNLDNAIAQIAKAGYTNVELYGYEKRMFFGKTVKQFKEILKKNHLKTVSGHYGFDDMRYEENYNWENWKALLEDANILGNKYVVVPWMRPENRKIDDFKRMADRLNKAGELSKAAGLITGYHNHDFEFAKQGDTCGMEVMLKGTDANLVKFEMDLYWVNYAGEDPIKWFKKAPGRFAMWHLKDMEKITAGKEKGQTCEVGNGIIDFKEIYKYKKLSGLDYAFVEQEQYNHPVFECIKTSADYIKANLM